MFQDVAVIDEVACIFERYFEDDGGGTASTASPVGNTVAIACCGRQPDIVMQHLSRRGELGTKTTDERLHEQ